jgi:hypothetical protein
MEELDVFLSQRKTDFGLRGIFQYGIFCMNFAIALKPPHISQVFFLVHQKA